ncbi:MAG: hypothetical protein IPL02_08280 [Moraxellaceae bacterium]|nr:hypothetical protein [Moraxellaceae bacterium]
MVSPTRPKFVIPLLYVVLDILGLMLLGLGSATILGKDVLPAAWLSFDFIGWLLIVAGLFLYVAHYTFCF